MIGPIYDPSGELQSAIVELRRRAWARVGLRHCASATWEPADSEAAHFIVKAEESVVAACQVSMHASPATVPQADLFTWLDEVPIPFASINRLVIDDPARGRGWARRLDEARIRWAETTGARALIAYTWQHRISGLRELGFVLQAVAPAEAIERHGYPPNGYTMLRLV